MKILITGAEGQLGSEIRRCLRVMKAEIGPLPIAYADAKVESTGHGDLDISDAAAVDTWFAVHGPYDVVFNCAAYANVDNCEGDEEGAYRANADGPENLSRACAWQGATFVHVSTDYVFSGSEPGERMESDPVGPLSAYGRTKLAGEERALAANPRTHVVRTAWLYGYAGKNFVKTMLRLGSERSWVTVVDDQLGNPTAANDLAYEILKIALSDSYGVWHCTNEGTCSWADFAQTIMDVAGLACEVRRCTSDEYKAANPQSASRPKYSSLRNMHLEKTFGNEMRSWRNALESYLENLTELGD